MRHLGEAIAEESVACKTERCEEGWLLRVRLEDNYITRASPNINACNDKDKYQE